MKSLAHSLMVLALASALVGAVHAQEGLEPYSPETVQDLQTMMDGYTQRGTPPGLVVWVDGPGQQFAGASGYSNLSAQTPMPPNALFRIASVSKVFTATLILQLAEDKALSLDDTLADWLPDLAAGIANGEMITIRQMLSHTSGIYDFTQSIEYGDALLATMTIEGDLAHVPCGIQPLEAITRYVVGQDAQFVPGARFEYSNTNFELLGLIIEATTGDSYVDVLHERILDPLDMTHTYLDCYEDPIDGLVHGYTSYEGQTLDLSDLHESAAPASIGLNSNAPDLVTFARALFTGQLFAGPATLDMMITPVMGDYGLGVAIMDGTYGHFGFTGGFSGMMQYVPETDTVIVVLLNGDNESAMTIYNQVLSVMRDEWSSE